MNFHQGIAFAKMISDFGLQHKAGTMINRITLFEAASSQAHTRKANLFRANRADIAVARSGEHRFYGSCGEELRLLNLASIAPLHGDYFRQFGKAHARFYR